MTEHIRCACGRSDCINEIRISSEGLWINHEKSPSQEMLMYLDANGIVEFIRKLRVLLLEKTNNGY